MEHFWQNIEGWSHPTEQGALMNKILSILPSEHLVIAEVGVYKGRCTAMWVVQLVNNNRTFDYSAIDDFSGYAGDGDLYSIASHNLSSISNQIKLIKNTSEAEVKNYPDNHFDIVYIDADHVGESPKRDISLWYPKVKVGGILCGDDYSPDWRDVIRAVDEAFGNNKAIIGRFQWMTVKQ